MPRSIGIITIIALLSMACATAMDQNSGGDHVRGKAKALKLNQTHDDRVSSHDGDHTDWKSLTIETGGRFDLSAYWDNPSIKAVVRVKDQFGGTIFELKHDSGQPVDHWRGIKLRDGEFYLEVVSQRGSSVYTLEMKSVGGGEFAPDPSVRRPE